MWQSDVLNPAADNLVLTALMSLTTGRPALGVWGSTHKHMLAAGTAPVLQATVRSHLA